MYTQILIILFFIHIAYSSLTWPYTIQSQDSNLTTYDLTLNQFPAVGSTIQINLQTKVEAAFLHINEFLCTKIIYKEKHDNQAYEKNYTSPRILNFIKGDPYTIRTNITLEKPYFNTFDRYIFKVSVGTFVPNPNPYVNLCHYHLTFQFTIDLRERYITRDIEKIQ